MAPHVTSGPKYARPAVMTIALRLVGWTGLSLAEIALFSGPRSEKDCPSGGECPMRSRLLYTLLAVSLSAPAIAQDAAPAGGRSTMANRPLNLANPRGTDSGAGVACNLVM